MKVSQMLFLFCFLGFHATAAAEEVVYAQIGEGVQLTLNYGSDKYLYWYFGDRQVAWCNPLGGKKINPEWQNRVSLSPNALVIHNITEADFGVFSCTVKDRLEEVAKEEYSLIQIHVEVDSPVLVVGEWLSLSCSVTNPVHTLDISWVDPHGHKNSGGVKVQAAHQHRGHWSFILNDGSKEKIERVKVAVIDLLPPAPVLPQFTSTVRPLTIPCSLSANTSWEEVQSKGVLQVGWNFCPPTPRCGKSSLLSLSLEVGIQAWVRQTEGMLQPTTNPRNGDLSLGRRLGRTGDAGDYECFMKFQNGATLSRTVRVEVLQIVASPGTQLTEGQQLKLTCTTGRSLPPDLRVQWFPPAESSLPAASTFAHVHIPRVGRADSGTWRCDLWRREELLTSAELLLRIDPVENSHVWMWLTLFIAAAILILLIVLIVIVQRRRQTGCRSRTEGAPRQGGGCSSGPRATRSMSDPGFSLSPHEKQNKGEQDDRDDPDDSASVKTPNQKDIVCRDLRGP